MNYQKKKFGETKAITLIALVITIIVLLILAGVTITALSGDNGILTNATNARISTELSEYKEKLEIYKIQKTSENIEFNDNTLTASKDSLSYNTKPADETGSIKTIIPEIKDKWVEKVEVVKGNLVLNTADKQEIKIAQSLGIEPNPYTIIDGELTSSENNLAMMDENGTLTIPGSVTSIGEGAFSNLSGLKKITIPGTVKSIGYNAFANNTDLEEVVIENGVETLGERAFYHCTNLQKVSFPDTITSIGATCFAGDIKLDNIELPEKLERLNTQVFMGCTSLKNLTLSKNLKSIGAETLLNTKITELKLPSQFQTIDSGSSLPATLENIDTSENNYFEFKQGILYTKNLKTLIFALSNVTSVTIESTVETIKPLAFCNCMQLKQIYIPESVNSIGYSAFSNITAEITVSAKNNYYMADEKYNLYSKDGTMLYRCAETGNVKIRDGVTNIQRGAFFTSGITNIELPNSFIGDKTNEWAVFPTLDTLILPENVNYFDKQTYLSVKNIQVDINNKNFKLVDNNYLLSYDETELYWVKSDLANVEIPSTVQVIKQCSLLRLKSTNTTITLPRNIKKIERSAFYESSIKTLEIQSNIEEMNSQALRGANQLSKVIIHKKKDSISGSPWGNPFGERAIIWDE